MKKILSICTLVMYAPSLTAFMYVSPEEPAMPLFIPRALSGKATTVSVGFTRTHGNEAFMATGSTVPFLEHYGTTQAADWFNGITVPAAGSYAHSFYSPTGNASITNMTDEDAPPYTPADATIQFRDPGNYYHFDSYHLALTQHLFSGFFIRLHFHIIEQELRQRLTAVGADAAHERVQHFLNSSDSLFSELGYQGLGYARRPSSIEHAGCYLGWSGSLDLTESAFEEISGTIMAGYNVEPSEFNEKIAPTILPYNRNDSFTGLASVMMQMLPHVACDASVAVTVHTTRKGDLCVVRDDLSPNSYYAGPVLLGTGFVRKDPGTQWVVQSSLIFNRLAGFYAALGYHFSHQERMNLLLLDSTILQGADWEGTPLSAAPARQNERINANPALEKWNNHSFFLSIGFTPHSTHHVIVPQFECGIYWPVMGYRSVAARPIYTGTGHISVRWTF